MPAEETVKEHFDTGSLVIILLTFVLFVVALFVKGMTKDMLLEIGVFLVSVKLIVMAYKASLKHQAISEDLREIKSMLRKM